MDEESQMNCLLECYGRCDGKWKGENEKGKCVSPHNKVEMPPDICGAIGSRVFDDWNQGRIRFLSFFRKILTRHTSK